MNRVNNEASRLIEIYCEIELKSGDDEEPKITKIFPSNYGEGEILKILPSFAFPYRTVNNNKTEKWDWMTSIG